MPGKLRAPKDFEWVAARPINQEWVRAGLARVGTTCEWPRCERPATQAFESICSVGYLCDKCTLRLQAHPDLCRRLDAALYERFREGFDFIYQVELTGGELLEVMEDHPTVEHNAVRDAARLEREMVRNILRALSASGEAPGMPGADLLGARGYAVQESGVLSGVIFPVQTGVVKRIVPPVSTTSQMRANMVGTDHEADPSEH